VISEEKKRMGLLDLATQLKLKQEDFAKQQGSNYMGNLPTGRLGGHLPLVMLETYALRAGNVGRFAYSHVGAIGCVAFGIERRLFNS